MSTSGSVSNVTAEELLLELRRRERAVAAPQDEKGLAAAGGDGLSEVDDATLVDALRSKQKVIYGTDDRQDLFEVTDAAVLKDADSVVALFGDGDVQDNGDGSSTLVTSNFGTSYNLCASERFRNQPVGAFCSGFLVGPDLVATAGHCINAGNVTQVVFVFGFRMVDANTATARVSNQDIYRGAAIVGWTLDGNGADWAVVRLDRSVTNHPVCDVRRTGLVPSSQAVHVIGHPSGLPTKYAPGAIVRDNSPAQFFVANLDTYGGNSGSPVFNSDTHVVEGILVRGEVDFVSNGSCTVSNVCPTTGCRGEDCTRATEFAAHVPDPGGPQLVIDNFAYDAGGWRVDKHPRFLADITGDGRDDIVGFGGAGVWVALNNGNGTFQAPKKVIDNFAYDAGGWRVDKHPRFLADITGDGRDDIVGFGNAGVWVRVSKG